MKFRFCLVIFVLFSMIPVLKADPLKQEYELGQSVERDGYSWKVSSIDVQEPQVGRFTSISVSQPKITYTFERNVISYLLKKKFEEKHIQQKKHNGEETVKVRKDKAHYETTTFGKLSFTGLVALAGYGLYNYFFGQTDS